MNPYLSYQQIIILGGGESGVGAALLALSHGIMPFLSDAGSIASRYKDELRENAIEFEENGHTESRILAAKLIIKSPGIPDHIPLLVQAKSLGIQIISEIEFASQFTDAKLIGITGTNGKTTTTLLTTHILRHAGYKVKSAGNIGNSFSREVAKEPSEVEYYILEMSSFQLDNIERLKFNLSVLLNISPDHLDRYGSMEAYIEAKLNISKNQNKEDKFIYNLDDDQITSSLDHLAGEPDLIPFSNKKTLDKGAYMQQQNLHLNLENDLIQFSVEDMLIKGNHNRYNSMAAAIVAKALNVKKEVIRESLTSYKNVSHRLEFIARIRNVDYINDSKATNVNAAWYALESMNNPTVWIAGGVDKGNDYSDLKELAAKKVKALICLGTDNEKIHAEFKDIIPIIVETDQMKEAVKIAYQLASKNDNVLLAPACASFDLFENYGDRGDQFRKNVLGL